MYGIDGGSDFDELELSHLEGYRGSRPVRIGNRAATQFQLDIYGELFDSIYLAEQRRSQAAVSSSPTMICRGSRDSSIGYALTGSSPMRGFGKSATAASASPTRGDVFERQHGSPSEGGRVGVRGQECRRMSRERLRILE
jgi:hypothetical protein